MLQAVKCIAFFVAVIHVNSELTIQREVTCGETISYWIDGDETHYYRLITDNLYNVNFEDCLSEIDLTVHILDDSISNNDVSSKYCPVGDWCGSCDNEAHYPENFTVPALPSGKYLIKLQPYLTSIIDGKYEFSITCVSHVSTIISCDETVFDSIDSGESKFYQLIINETIHDLNFQNCASLVDLVVTIYNNSGNDISSKYCSSGDWCGSCDNADYYPENITIPILTPGKYIIDIQTFSSTIVSGVFVFKVSCNSKIIHEPTINISYPSINTTTIPEVTEVTELTSTNFYSTLLQTQKLECESTIKGQAISPLSTVYYYFHLSDNTTGLVFDSCKSAYGTKLRLWNSNWKFIKKGHSYLNCDTQYHEQLLLESLQAGEYILEIGGFALGEWVVEIICNYGCQHIKCGDVTTNMLEHQKSSVLFHVMSMEYYHRYCFTLSDASYLIYFDTCGSQHKTWLNLMNTNYSTIKKGTYGDDGYCGDNDQQIKIEPYSLETGLYILDVESNDCWFSRMYPTIDDDICMDRHTLSLTCTENLVDQYKYKILIATFSQWISAQLECEKQYGTSLATILTKHDLYEAISISYNYSLYHVWIGMFNNKVNRSEWGWIVDGSCDVGNEDCVEWKMHSANSSDDMTGTFLSVYNQSFYTLRNEQIRKSIRIESPSAICNAPKEGYKAGQCSELQNCWHYMSRYNDSALILDTAFDIDSFIPPIAYWNSTLFIIGIKQIHYAYMETLQHPNVWNHTSYDHTTLKTYADEQKYAQYRSSLYLLTYSSYNSQDILIHMDLNTLNTKYHVVPTDSLGEYCMVAGGNYVYIKQTSSILIYDVRNNTWNSVDVPNITPTSCVITNDHKYIYFFGIEEQEVNVIKYTIESTHFENLNIPNLCSHVSTVSAVISGNGKIYLHGCYPSSGTTIIFDTKLNQFELKTINIDVPTTKNIPFYRKSQLAVFDDNILLLVHTTDTNYPRLYLGYEQPSISLYYTITQLNTINLTETISSKAIFPSDGFTLKYNLNDFTNASNISFDILFSYMYENINALIQLNPSKDNCLCVSYHCRNCYQYFDSKRYLTLKHNHIFELKLSPIYYDSNVLILPKMITIPLQRCIISFNDFDKTVTDDKPMVNFTFSLSNNCYSRIGTNFSLNITSPALNIFKQLIITIVNNSTRKCKICNIGNIVNCSGFHDNSFQIGYNAKKSKSFDIMIESNMIDLQVNTSTKNTFKYIASHVTT
eukprot:524915_1